MLPQQHRQEEISIGFLQTVAGCAGWTCEFKRRDYGIDATVSYVEKTANGAYRETGHALQIQLKSTTSYEDRADEIAYDLEVKNYSDLIQSDVGTPRILVVYCLPSDDTKWVTTSRTETRLETCGYWVTLRGGKPTTNKETIRIAIPKANLFDCDSVSSILQRIRAGKLP